METITNDRLTAREKGCQMDKGYLQHGNSKGPFLTESVAVVNEHGDRWLARYEGKWRRVNIQVNRTFIVYRGERITIQIDGL